MSGAYYSGPACPRCGNPVDLSILEAGEQICPRCLDPYLAMPFTPPEPRRLTVETLVEIIEVGPAGAVPCGRHAGNAAVANCSRCGVFMCSLCRLAIDGQELCPGCFDRLSSEGVLSSARNRIRDYRGLSLSLGVLGSLFCVFGVLTGPLTLYTVFRGVQQKRRMNEAGGALSLLVAGLLGLVQTVMSTAIIIGMIRT
jgi:uncharacterized paraquat-inducible protein A